MTTLIILALAALITSTLSGIIGMGGGMLLLAVLFSFLSHAEAIPTHAAVQIASNGTRVLAFLRNVVWSDVARFGAGMIPGGVIGAMLLWVLGEPDESEPYFKLLVGAYILTVTFWPARKREAGAGSSVRAFAGIGFLAGLAALTVGAVGPLIAPVFARQGYVKERLIATKATCQMLTHVSKIPVFLTIRDLPVERLALLTAVMIAMVIPGTLLGKHLLKYVSDANFVHLYKIALTMAGVKVLVWDGLVPLVFPSV